MIMQKSLAIFTGSLLAICFSACSSDLSVVSEARPEDVQGAGAQQKFKWPHTKPMSAKEEEEFNIDYTSLDGTFKSGKERVSPAGKEFVITIDENAVEFVISGKKYASFQKEEFEKKAKAGTALKFLVEHLEAEQPHADPKTGALSISVQGVIAGNDNIDLIKTN